MSKSSEKQFDAVRMMREIRDELSRKLVNLSHQEQGRYIREQLSAQAQDPMASREKAAAEPLPPG